MSDNTAEVGGAIDYGVSPGTRSSLGVSLINVTISDNHATLAGGGLYSASFGVAVLTTVTIADNTAPESAGIGGEKVELRNSILANNTGGNCSTGAVTSQGYNPDSGTSCGLNSDGDRSNTNPQLGALSDNGGPTLTHPLLANSPAIDTGDPDNCPSVDQRGTQRPTDGIGDRVARCDIGAYEAAGIPVSGAHVYLPLVLKN